MEGEDLVQHFRVHLLSLATVEAAKRWWGVGGSLVVREEM